MPKKLQSLKIKKFRGATSEIDLTFETDKPLILFFGENGTGKSTIVDAIDFVCNQEVKTLRGRQGTSLARHAPSIGSKPADVLITLNFGSEQWSGSMKGQNTSVVGPAGCPKAKILRRASLLEFLDMAAADRYKALGSFINVSKVEGSEQSLRDAKKLLKEEMDRATQGKADSLREIEALWKVEGSALPNPVEWAAAKAQANLQILEKSQRDMVSILNTFERCLKDDETRKAFESQRSSRQLDLNNAVSSLKEAEKASAESESKLLSLLDWAELYLDDHPAITACPVCEQSVNPIKLKAQIAVRRAAGSTVARAASQVRQAGDALQQSTSRLEEQNKRMLADVQELINLAKASSLSILPASPIPTPITLAQATSFLKEIDGQKALIESARTAATTDIANLKNIQRLSASLAKDEQTIIDSKPLLDRVEKALEIVEKTRKAYIDRILKSVSGRVDALYSLIHPNEKVGGIKFLLDPDKRGSLSVQADFETQSDIPPQAFYSESHLDTLGICIFLALAEGDSADEVLILLDDVLTSADQSHMDRFLDMLHDEFASHRQVILTTHYRPLRERYTYSYGSSIKVQMIDLLPWTLARGARHTKAKLEIDELRKLLEAEPLDRQTIAGKAGVLLEAALDKLTLLYGCRVRRKPSGDYTLGDLLDGIDSKLRKALQSDAGLLQPAVGLADVLTKLSSMTWIRNRIGAHFNRKAGDIMDKQVLEFGQATLELLDALICPKCGELPRNKNDGSRWHCGCKTRWLAPLALPGEALSESAAG